VTPTIAITVDPEGRARVETHGYAGPACREASRYLERALGLPARETLTAAFHQRQADREHLREPG
jgi:hypothetical protein